MDEVAIIGAGELGGTLGHLLARREVAATVRLVDATGQIAAGKALDIAQAAGVEGFATTVLGATDLMAAAGAAVIVLADRAGTPSGVLDPSDAEWHGEDALMLLKRIAQIAAGAVVICAGARYRELLERGVRELGLRPEKLFGSAPEALASAVRAMIALETNGSPADVACTILGTPPSHIVVPWEDATIGGFAAVRVLDEPARRRIAARVAALWPPGPYALGVAAAKAVEAVLGRSRRMMTAFVAPDDSTGMRTRATALPVRLGRAGIARVALPPLNARDRVALDNAMLL